MQVGFDQVFGLLKRNGLEGCSSWPIPAVQLAYTRPPFESIKSWDQFLASPTKSKGSRKGNTCEWWSLGYHVLGNKAYWTPTRRNGGWWLIWVSSVRVNPSHKCLLYCWCSGEALWLWARLWVWGCLSYWPHWLETWAHVLHGNTWCLVAMDVVSQASSLTCVPFSGPSAVSGACQKLVPIFYTFKWWPCLSQVHSHCWCWILLF